MNCYWIFKNVRPYQGRCQGNETRFSRAMKFAKMSRDSITRESGCMEVFVTANINCMFMAVLMPDET